MGEVGEGERSGVGVNGGSGVWGVGAGGGVSEGSLLRRLAIAELFQTHSSVTSGDGEERRRASTTRAWVRVGRVG